MDAATPTVTIPDWLRGHTDDLHFAIDNGIPHPPHDARYPRTKLEKELKEHALTCLFERILDGMCEGDSARAIIKVDHNRFQVGEVMKWIHTNPVRKRKYDEAESIRAIVENDIVNDIVADEAADPTYKKERVDWHKWRAARANREKFGDKTTIESNTTVVVDLRAKFEQRSLDYAKTIEHVPYLLTHHDPSDEPDA